MKVSKILFLGLMITTSACSVFAGPDYEVVSRESVDDQAKVVVDAYKTNFSASAKDSSAIWARVKMFFDFFLVENNADSSKLYEVREDLFTNETIPSQKYSYRVARSFASSGEAYFNVKCFARPGLGGTNVLAERNAKNLARFMKEGYFEASLLDK